MNVFQLQEHAMEQQREKTLAALQRYQQEKYSETECESLSQLLYNLLRNTSWEDGLHQYQEGVVTLMAFLSKPSVVDLLRRSTTAPEQCRVSQMLLHFYNFLRCLGNEEYYSLLLRAVEIEQTDDQDKLQSLERSYQAKLAGFQVEQQIERDGEIISKRKAVHHV